MRAASAAVTNLANPEGAGNCTKRTKTCTVSQLQSDISDLLKQHFPHKTWAVLADAFGLKERAAKHRLANNSSYTIEELQLLFQSGDGLDYLNAMMADAAPAWWVWWKQVMAQAEKRRIAAEATQEALQLEAQLPPTAAARRLTKSNADASKKLSAAFARKEAALGFLRPNGDRPIHRAVAQAKGKR